MADLVSGLYGQQNPWQGIIGLQNAVQSNVPARTNAEYLGLSTITDGALAATGVAFAVPVPVDPGTVISYVSILVGGTAASVPTHSFAALYSGTNVAAPPLIGQSTDGTSVTTFASGAVTVFTLTNPQRITPAQAPYGFVYAAVSITATTIPTAMAVATPTAVGYQWFTSSTTPKGNSPLFLSATAGSSLAGTAAATFASPSAKAVAPIVILH